MVILFQQLSRETDFKGYSVLVEKMKEFEKVSDLIKYPRLDGDWRIGFIDIPIADVRELMKAEYPKHVNITFFLKKDVIDNLREEYPKYFSDVKSRWELYLDFVANLEKPIERRASSELYKRARGDLKVIRDVIDEILQEYPEDEVITHKQIISTILHKDNVYARDVILHLLLKHNKLVGQRSLLSKYKFNSWEDKLQDLIEEIGHNAAFYSIRKYVNNLYENKMSYLYTSSSKIKDIEVLKIVDVYEIMYMNILFIDKNPQQLYPILKMIEGRKETNVDYFYRSINTDGN